MRYLGCMTELIIRLRPDEARQLIRLAKAERRLPPAQAAWLLAQQLRAVAVPNDANGKPEALHA